MKSQKTYRELLIDTLLLIEGNYQRLLVLGIELVMYEDRKAGLVPFEDGDEIPIDIEVFEASDIPAVQTIAHAILLFQHICSTLRNMNTFTIAEIDSRRSAAEHYQEPEPEMSTDEDLSFEDFKSAVYISLSETMYYCNLNAYSMIYGEDASEDLRQDFYFPGEETYELLSSNDTNIRLLVNLSEYLEGHRDLVWKV